MPHDVFISHSAKDKAIADAVCAKLESEGIRCWMTPRDILAGQNWGGAIIEAINNCRMMVLVFSSNANQSQQILREVERAVNKGVHIIPFRIDDVSPTPDLEYYIMAQHWLDALTPPIEQHIDKLCETVKRIIPERSAQPGSPEQGAGDFTPPSEPPSPPVKTASSATQRNEYETIRPAPKSPGMSTNMKVIFGVIAAVILIPALWYLLLGPPIKSIEPPYTPEEISAPDYYPGNEVDYPGIPPVEGEDTVMYTLLYDKCHTDALCVIKNCRVYHSEYTQSRQCAIDFWNDFRDKRADEIENSTMSNETIEVVYEKCADSVACLTKECKYEATENGVTNWVDQYVCFSTIRIWIKEDTEKTAQIETDPSLLTLIENSCARGDKFCVYEICEESIEDSMHGMRACFIQGFEIVAYEPVLDPAGCAGTITTNANTGYYGDDLIITVVIPEPYREKVSRVTTSHPECMDCGTNYVSPGVFNAYETFRVDERFRISFKAYDANGALICEGTTPELRSLGTRP